MTQDMTPVQEEIDLGKTHFQLHGYDEVFAFSPEAIENDNRWPEIFCGHQFKALNQNRPRLRLKNYIFTIPSDCVPRRELRLTFNNLDTVWP